MKEYLIHSNVSMTNEYLNNFHVNNDWKIFDRILSYDNTSNGTHIYVPF